MNQFNKLPSIIQIFIAEWLAVMFVFPVASKFYERSHPAVGYHSLSLDKADYAFFVVGLLLFAWLLATIFRPAVHATRYVPVFHAGGVYVSNPQMAADYLFSSTHPSYVFVDVMSVGFWWFVRWLWSEGWSERVYQGTLLLVIAALIPALRLFAWYVLRLRPKGDEVVHGQVRSAWKPVAMLYGFFLLPLALGGLLLWIHMERQDKQMRANLPVIEPENWKGNETFEALRDEAYEHGFTTRLVRLRATQKSSAATTCTSNAGQGVFGSVLASLGKDDDVLIVSIQGQQDGVNKLAQRAEGNQGKTIEILGRLRPMPKQVAAWKTYCGLEKLSPRPRWVFEEW